MVSQLKRMLRVRNIFIILLGLYLMFFTDQAELCVDTGVQPPKPSIHHLRAISDKQSLVVSWLVNHSSLVGDIYELQISRVEKHNIIYCTNVSVSSEDVAEWTWISDLPLECVDHSVRIRHFCNQSVPSPWSDWMTSYGFKSKDKQIPIFPSYRVLREGTSATFCCVPSVGVNITSMTFRNNQYPLINIGAGVKAISVHNLTILTTFFKQQLFGCNDSAGKSNYTWNYVSVPPEKPRDLSCETTDMTTVTCTWSPGRDPGDGNKQTHTLHIENSEQAPITCEPSSCTFPAVPQLQEYNISVVVKDKLGEETQSYSFNISERVFPVVEWSMVRPEVTEATLSWHLQGNFTEMNVHCQVSTVPGSIIKSCYNVSFCKVKLEHLLPNTRYSTRARCSVNNRVWGNWTTPKYFTTSPLVTLDLWRKINQPSNSNSRLVTLLWKPHISGTAATVSIQGYTVKWSQDGHMQTEWKDSGHRQVEVSIGPGKCDFTVQADLHPGSSIPAHISIPAVEHTEKPPLPKRLSSAAAGGFNLSWNKVSTATCGYTVEWCILGNAVTCPLDWMQVPKGNNTLFLPADHFKAGCRYMFNIYGCTENGHTFLEIQTGYSQELKSVQSPSLVEPVQSTSSSVTLEWHYNEDDPAQPAIITGYLVTVQEVLAGQTAKLLSVSVSDPQRKSVTVQDLQQDQDYVCSVSALSKEGPGPQASITVRTKINYPAHLAKILTPILLVLTCTFLLWPQRKMLKDIFVYPAGMDIKMHDSDLCEADYRLHPQPVDECITCDVEFVNTTPPPNEALTPREHIISQSLPDFQGPFSSVPLQAEYCPQTAMLGVWDRPDPPQTTGLTNKSYLYTLVEDCSEFQQCDFSEILLSFQPSDGLQECDVLYGYISSDAS